METVLDLVFINSLFINDLTGAMCAALGLKVKPNVVWILTLSQLLNQVFVFCIGLCVSR